MTAPPDYFLNHMKPTKLLKKDLDRYYHAFDFTASRRHDPVLLPRRYSSADDIEAAGFIASFFSYGKVTLFIPVIEKILKPMGRHPAAFLANFSLKRDARRFRGIYYRFHTEQDILFLIYCLSIALKEHGSLKNLFNGYYSSNDDDIGHALTRFLDYFNRVDRAPVYGKRQRAGRLHFFPSPEKKSACKRMNLFLRWMIRDRDVDFGIWQGIPSSRLVIPLDTHLLRISRCIGLTQRASSDWKTARDITKSLKALDPADPLKYDFALCHLGISGRCRGPDNRESCGACEFSSYNA